MNQEVNQLLENNKLWAQNKQQIDANFFTRTAKKQTPNYLWIGCADSRVPATQVLDLQQGDLLVHRNIANQIHLTDLNTLSVIEFAVIHLQVQHIIICGHYGCKGVLSAIENTDLGLINPWLTGIKETQLAHKDHLKSNTHDSSRFERMCELNVLTQVKNLCNTPTLQTAWHQKKQKISVHGWIYNIANGLIENLKCSINDPKNINKQYQEAVEKIINKTT